MATTTNRRDPYRGFNFLVEIIGVTQAGFQECGGLDTQTAVIDYREGSDKSNHLRKIPGMNSFSAISLKRGITDSKDLWDWYQKGDRRTGSIILLDETGTEKARWTFSEAWPSKWTGPAFNASGNAIAIESLEITHEALTRP
jgi:phage tail-like protein